MPLQNSNEQSSSGLELVRLLLRRISRGFYQSKHSILLDIVLKHSAIRDDHLALIMGLQNQEARKLCGRLREDRILTMHTRQEVKEGQNRPIHRTYYYIDFRDAVDAVKYRVHRLVRTIEEQSKNDFDSKGYVCPYCQRRYGALDVLPLISVDGQTFQCADCRSVLVDDEESMESKVSQERLGRLQKQTKRIVSTLKDIDASFVPDNDFISAFANAIPPSLEMLYTSSYPHGLPSAPDEDSSTIQTTTAALGVKMDYNTSQQDTPEEVARKLAQAQMNQLPEWHLHSTVSRDVSAYDSVESAPDVKMNVKEIPLDAAASDEVAEYYKSLKAQQQAESDSSDEDEFEESSYGEVNEVRTVSTAEEISISRDDQEESEEEFEDL